MMAEFDCFITRSEFLGLLQNALVEGYSVQVKKHLIAPVPATCSTAEDLVSAMDEGLHAFLLEKPGISRYPVELVPVDKGGSQFWYARSKEGGPLIEAHYFAPFENAEGRFIPCSLITYHSKIINPNTGEFEAAGDPIKDAFSRLLAPLRRAGRKVKSEKRSAIVSPGVDLLLASGWSLAAPFTQE